jgi:hypothetical protein
MHTHSHKKMLFVVIAIVLLTIFIGIPAQAHTAFALVDNSSGSPVIGSSDLTTGSSELPIIGGLFPRPKPKQGTPVRRVIHTVDGKRLELVVYRSSARPSRHGLDPFSREGYVSTRVAARIAGLVPGDAVTARLKVGYSIGYPVSLFPEGVNVTLTTPSLQLKGQVDASINPQITVNPSGGGGSIGEIKGQLGAEVTVIPPQQAEFTVAPGGIKDIEVTDFPLVSPTAEVFLMGGHITVTTALGPVTIRPFAKLAVMTNVGVYELELHNTHTSDVAL